MLLLNGAGKSDAGLANACCATGRRQLPSARLATSPGRKTPGCARIPPNGGGHAARRRDGSVRLQAQPPCHQRGVARLHSTAATATPYPHPSPLLHLQAGNPRWREHGGSRRQQVKPPLRLKDARANQLAEPCAADIHGTRRCDSRAARLVSAGGSRVPVSLVAADGTLDQHCFRAPAGSSHSCSSHQISDPAALIAGATDPVAQK